MQFEILERAQEYVGIEELVTADDSCRMGFDREGDCFKPGVKCAPAGDLWK